MMTLVQQLGIRVALSLQHVMELQSKIEHYEGRVARGTADDEDRVALDTYLIIKDRVESVASTFQTSLDKAKKAGLK